MAQLSEKLHEADWLQLEKVVSDIYAKLGCATWRNSNIEGENNFSLVIERAGKKDGGDVQAVEAGGNHVAGNH